MSKCIHCQERDAEPSFVRCEPCMVRDMTAEVRFVWERVRILWKLASSDMMALIKSGAFADILEMAEKARTAKGE